jgi:hypothetical protein
VKLTKTQLRQMIQEAASEYVWGVKNPGRVANKYKISVLKKLIKEELEVILTNEEAGEMFGEEVQTQLEEQEGPLNEDPSYAEALQVMVQATAKIASIFGPAMTAGLFLKVAKDAFTKALSKDPVATQTDTDTVMGDLLGN